MTARFIIKKLVYCLQILTHLLPLHPSLLKVWSFSEKESVSFKISGDDRDG